MPLKDKADQLRPTTTSAKQATIDIIERMDRVAGLAAIELDMVRRIVADVGKANIVAELTGPEATKLQRAYTSLQSAVSNISDVVVSNL